MQNIAPKFEHHKKSRGRPKKLPLQKVVPLDEKLKPRLVPNDANNHLYFVGITQELTRWSNSFFAGNIVVKTPNHPRNGVVCFKDYYGFDVNYKDFRCYKPVCEFYFQAIKDVIEQDNEAKFMFYSQQCFIYSPIMSFYKHFVCVNNENIVGLCNHKYSSREKFQDFANVLEYQKLYKYEITPFLLDRAFGKKFRRWVIQEPIGFSGLGTFLMDRKNYTRQRLNFVERFPYRVCRYVEDNIPVNVHFLISQNEIVIFDATVQKLKITTKIYYESWSFEEFDALSKNLQQKVYAEAKRLAKGLKDKGYVGIGGADFVIEKNKVWFIEVNPRFQISSEGLDKRLQKQGFPSLFKLNFMSFYEPEKFGEIAKQISH